MIVPTIISLLLRFLLRRETLPPSKGSLAIYIVTFLPAFFLSNYLIKIGTTRRDPTTGTLISYGEDLSQTGVTEWCFDVLYVTCQSLYAQRLLYRLNNLLQGLAKSGVVHSANGFGGYTWSCVLKSPIWKIRPIKLWNRSQCMLSTSFGLLWYLRWSSDAQHHKLLPMVHQTMWPRANARRNYENEARKVILVFEHSQEESDIIFEVLYNTTSHWLIDITITENVTKKR